MNSSYSLGFTTQSNEIQRRPLEVTGQIPTWLSGTLIRNGPARFEVGSQPYRHWFDGLAMLHGLAFRDGQVFYSNRFLRSGAFVDAAKTGKIVCGEFATSPQRSFLGWLSSLFFPQPADNGCVNVSMVDGVHIAMTETPHRIVLALGHARNTRSLPICRPVEGPGRSTAHPHYDFERREVINFVTGTLRKSAYHVYRIKGGQRRRELMATVPVEEPGYMHSFAVTENYVILVEHPLVVRPLDLFFGRKPFIENFQSKPSGAPVLS